MTRRQRGLTPGVEGIQLVTRERVWNMLAIAKRHQRQAEALPVSENHSSADGCTTKYYALNHRNIIYQKRALGRPITHEPNGHHPSPETHWHSHDHHLSSTRHRSLFSNGHRPVALDSYNHRNH